MAEDREMQEAKEKKAPSPSGKKGKNRFRGKRKRARGENHPSGGEKLASAQAEKGKPKAQHNPGGFSKRKFKRPPRPRPKGRRKRGRASRAKHVTAEAPPVEEEAPPTPKVVEIPASLSVRELAERMGVSPIAVIKELMRNGMMANINQIIDFDTAAIVASEMGFEVKEEAPPVPEEAEPELPKTFRQLLYEGEALEDLVPRPPVVTVLGHVDHGKTTLLDAIRRTKVAEEEAGGITQRIGAYQVEVQGRKITFIDTPGHEAFTAMRARGAQVTDIAVLVVAADDGVMPQTVEAIDHARAAQVPIIVAINKIDKPEANPERVKRQLADLSLTAEDWGGDVICVPISAKKRIGIEELLENILLVADLEGLKANPNRPAVGTVIEGKMDEKRGPMATLLVQNGTLKVGDVVVVGSIYGRVRAMLDDEGKPLRKAPPSTPVAIMGLSEVPRAGDIFEVVKDEKTARSIIAKRLEEERLAAARPTKALSLDELYAQIQMGKIKELNLILKVDAQGSLEPIVNSLEKLGSEELKVRIIHQGTGNVSESDVMLAIASRALIIGFAVDVDPAARRLADTEGVDIRLYDVIYHLVDDIDKALKGLLEPVYEEVVIGHAEVRAIFKISKVGKVAGVYVLDGKITRDALARIQRDGNVVYDGRVASLKRFTEDVKEVNAGFECGLGLEDFQDFVEGDIIEFYKKEKVS